MKTKLRYIWLTVFLCMLAFGLTGCPGGGGGSGTHVPSLSNLYLSPSSVPQNTGNGSTTVSFNFEVSDAGGDVASMSAALYDGNGTLLESATNPLEGGAGIQNGYIQGTFNCDTTKAANYKVSFSVTDAQGGTSNVVDAVFTVTPVASLVAIKVTSVDADIDMGAKTRFTATGTYDDGTALNITDLVSWSSSDAAVATIDASGLATGKSHGSTMITASADGVSGFTALSVAIGFATGLSYPPPSGETMWLGNTAIGDLNGDGRNDVAVIDNLGNGTHILIYTQNAGHVLDTPQVITTDLAITGIVIADADQDGLAELIVSGNSTTASSPRGRVYVYRQDPATHVLGAPQQYTLSTDSVGGLAVADLNDDTLPDIVTAGTGTGTNGVVSFLFQTANGAFAPEVTYTGVPVYAGGEVHAADMNNDGLNDVVLQSGALQLAVLKQVSAGAFSTTPDLYTVQTDYWPGFGSFALGDLNGDGKTDVAVADLNGSLNIFLQDSSGQLTGPAFMSLSSEEIHITDIDGDGLNDIVSIFANTVHILSQAADHSFPALGHMYRLSTQCSSATAIHQVISIGDVTGDGFVDIVASCMTDGIYVLPRLP